MCSFYPKKKKLCGMEPRFNEPRYNKFFDMMNIIRKPKRKFYPIDTANYKVNTRQKIDVEQIISQQIFQS